MVPRVEHLAVFIRMLSRSGVGAPITQYTSHFRAPRPGAEMHIVLVDNGRSERLGMPDFWRALKCIRCAACLNTCPVYRRGGGLSYGATYAGPIGIVLNPSYDRHKYRNLPFACTLNGSCANVCPVKIDLHGLVYKWRQVLRREGEIDATKLAIMRAAGVVLGNPALYRAAISAAGGALAILPRVALHARLNAWARGREMPSAPWQSFHEWYREQRGRQ
jgi:L-lactate dehydrogenase complex protein LldF